MAPVLLKPAVKVRAAVAAAGERAAFRGVAASLTRFSPPRLPQAVGVRAGRSEFAAGSLADSFRGLALAKPEQAAAPAAFRVESARPVASWREERA
jgi:hypothetical protein